MLFVLLRFLLLLLLLLLVLLLLVVLLFLVLAVLLVVLLVLQVPLGQDIVVACLVVGGVVAQRFLVAIHRLSIFL